MGAGFGGSVIAAANSRDLGEITPRLGSGQRIHRVTVVDGALA